jgi:hypothetical protein
VVNRLAKHEPVKDLEARHLAYADDISRSERR